MDNNLIKQPFGLNIALPQRTMQEVQKVAKQEIENITVNPFVEFLNKTYSLSPEEVTTSLRKAQGQIYALGQAMRDAQPTRTFNVKI